MLPLKNYWAIVVLAISFAACQPSSFENQGGILIELSGISDKQSADATIQIIKQKLRNTTVFEPAVQYDEKLQHIVIKLSREKDTIFFEQLLLNSGDLQIVEEYSRLKSAMALFDIAKSMAEHNNYGFDLTGRTNKVDSSFLGLFMEINDFENLYPEYAPEKNISLIDSIVQHPELSKLLPADFNYQWEFEKHAGSSQNKWYKFVATRKPVDYTPITKQMIATAKMQLGPSGAYEVALEFKPQYHKTWADLTRNNIGKMLVIMVDSKVYSAPKVMSEITGGQANISGDFTKTEATRLANLLITPPLPKGISIAKIELVTRK